MYSWKGMSLVNSLRDWAILSAVVVTEVAAVRKEASLYVGVAWGYGGEDGGQ